MLRVLLLTCCVVVCAAEARAQTVTDKRVWAGLTLVERGTPDTPWRWTLETFVRTRDGAGTVDVIGIRPILIYAVTPHSTVGGGYAFGPSFPASGGTSIEHRVFGQYIWTGSAGGWAVSLRTRVEARFFEGNSGPVGRVRQQVRFSHAVWPGSRVAIVASDEFFVHLNDTTRTARGIDQNRVFGGVSIALSSGTRAETGYLHQFSPGHRGAPDRLNHVLFGALVVSF